MKSRLIQPIKTKDTYKYLKDYMTREKYLERLGKVKLVKPKKQKKEGFFPHIELFSTIGEKTSIAEIAKESNIVLFFYPGDKEGIKYPELAGCTPEACSFRDAISELEKLNTKIFGISYQSPERQKEFLANHHLNFHLLSDSSLALSNSIGLPRWKSENGELYPYRQTYLIKKGNEIYKVFEKVEPKDHINDVINEIRELENTLTLK